MTTYVVPYCRFCATPGNCGAGNPFHWGRCNNPVCSVDGTLQACDCPGRLNNMRDARWPVEPRREGPPAALAAGEVGE